MDFICFWKVVNKYENAPSLKVILNNDVYLQSLKQSIQVSVFTVLFSYGLMASW